MNMDKNGNMNKVPEDSMPEHSGDAADFSAFLANRITEAQINELVENLYDLTRDQDIGVVAQCVNYIQQWVDANVNFDVLDKKNAFFEGFFAGGRCVQKLYSHKNKTKRRDESE